MVNRVMVAAAVVGAAIGVSSANAAVVGTIDLSTGGSTFFGNVKPAAGTFSDTFKVVVPQSSVSATVTNIGLLRNNAAGDIDFSSVTFNGTALDKITSDSAANHFTESFSLLTPLTLAAGTYDFVVSGRSFGNASYSGVINVSAVPEPAAWALMLGGFGLVGAAMRRRRTTVRFA